jgi:hypothetical protein
MNPRPQTHHQNVGHFVRGRCAGDSYFDRVEMTAHVTGIEVRQGHVDGRTRSATFFVDGTMASAFPG